MVSQSSDTKITRDYLKITPFFGDGVYRIGMHYEKDESLIFFEISDGSFEGYIEIHNDLQNQT
jgi:hypothetical protein